MIVKLVNSDSGQVMITWFDSDAEHRNALWIRSNYPADSQISCLIRLAARNHAIRLESKL